jgi:hypothetical protein
VVDEAATMKGPPVMKGLFQRIQDETGMRGPAGSPTDNPPGVGIGDEGHTDEPSQGRT